MLPAYPIFPLMTCERRHQFCRTLQPDWWDFRIDRKHVSRSSERRRRAFAGWERVDRWWKFHKYRSRSLQSFHFSIRKRRKFLSGRFGRGGRLVAIRLTEPTLVSSPAPDTVPPLRKKSCRGETHIVFDHTSRRPNGGAYFVLPPSTFSLSLAAACAAAKRAVSTRNGEHET